MLLVEESGKYESVNDMMVFWHGAQLNHYLPKKHKAKLKEKKVPQFLKERPFCSHDNECYQQAPYTYILIPIIYKNKD